MWWHTPGLLRHVRHLSFSFRVDEKLGSVLMVNSRKISRAVSGNSKNHILEIHNFETHFAGQEPFLSLITLCLSNEYMVSK